MTAAVNVVPIVIAATRRRVFRAFRDAGATGQAAAIDYEPRRLVERRQFDRMLRDGVIRDIAGRYWLDEKTASEWNASRRKRGLIAAGAALAAAAIAIALSPK